jgi:nucleoside 2-deoxyribosyltransferase
MRIYLAGPLFTTAERDFNARLCALLSAAGHEVWLPQDHEPRENTAMAIFQEDVAGMEWSQVVVANMDGPDPDSGTCWECGYAYKRKRIILYRTDFRRAGDAGASPFNLMLSESADFILDMPMRSVEDVARDLCPLLEECAKKQTGNREG